MTADSYDQKIVENLVEQARKGDQDAFSALYEKYYDQIYRYVYFKCGSRSDAEDITGQVFLKMLEAIHSFKWKGHPFTSWLYRIAHNQIIDNFRRKNRSQTIPFESVNDQVGIDSADIDRVVSINVTMAAVWKAMDGLTDLQREVISLRFGSGLSIDETASAVGRNGNAVKALQHAGLKKLRQIMDAKTHLIRQPSVMIRE